jgi:hypothetical protein
MEVNFAAEVDDEPGVGFVAPKPHGEGDRK